MQSPVIMATTGIASVPVEETVFPTAERSSIASPIGWSSILAATVISLGVWLLLHLFGVAVGLTALDPRDAGSLKGAGIGVGIWSITVPLIALFIGGLVAGRVAPTINTMNAAIHGAVVWALTLLVAMFMVVNMLGSIARGVGSAGKEVAGGAMSAAGHMGGVSLDDVGLKPDDVFAPINKELQERGAPPVSPERAKDAAQEVVRTAVQGGDLSREKIIDIVAKRTELSRADAEKVAGDLEQRVQSMKQQAGKGLVRAQEVALGAAEGAGKALLALCALMLLSLGAAVLGAILSVRHERRTHVVLPHARTTSTTTTV